MVWEKLFGCNLQVARNSMFNFKEVVFLSYLCFLFSSAFLVLEDAIYVDENGTIVEEPTQQDLRAVEFNFLDSKNICCGLCGEIVPYDLLMSEHLPLQHPEVYLIISVTLF